MALPRKHAAAALVGVALLSAVALAFVPPIAQPQDYMRFADERTWMGIANAQNVLSNVGFLIVGLWGLAYVAATGRAFATPIERLPYLIFFLGVTLTGFGSAYFHLAPSNESLVWDRLPMTIAFTALFAAILGERTSVRTGIICLPLFLLAGAGSVVYWFATENAGRGDLRPYFFVQFFPIVGIPLLYWLFPARYTRGADIFWVIAGYIVAKLCEGYDAVIYAATGHVVSGHALKHVVAAGAIGFVLRMLQRREPV